MKNLWFWLVMAVILTGYLLFPGDVWWVNDEPRLIELALARNALGQWWGVGISGGNGTPYGPVPVVLYQLFLKLTPDLVRIVFLKTLFCWSVVFFSLLKLARDLKLSRATIPVAFLSPLVFLFCRGLWDNVFLVPFSALFVACVVGYLIRSSRSDLIGASVMGVILFHIHLMSLFVLGPAVVAVTYHLWSRTRTEKTFAGLCVLGAAIISLPYLKVLASPSISQPYGDFLLGEVLGSPFVGARVLGFAGFFDYYVPEFYATAPYLGKTLLRILIAISLVGPLISLWGMARAYLTWGQDRSGLFIFLCLVPLATMVVFAGMRLRSHPHYINSTWAIYFLFFWMTLDVFLRRPAGRALLAGYVASSVVLLVTFVSYIHLNGGTRGDRYGATLHNQIDIASSLPKSGDLSSIEVEVTNFTQYPQSLDVLRKLYGNDESIFPKAIRYAGNSAEIVAQ